MGAQEIHRDHFPNIDEGGAVEKQYDNDRRRIEISSLTNRKNTIMLRGAMIFHRIGEYAILAVIAIALTNIPLSLLSGATMSRVTVHALSPAPCLSFGSSSQRTYWYRWSAYYWSNKSSSSFTGCSAEFNGCLSNQ